MSTFKFLKVKFTFSKNNLEGIFFAEVIDNYQIKCKQLLIIINDTWKSYVLECN